MDTEKPHPRRRRSTKGAQTRERIFAAALERFSNDGFETASMRAIAQDAGVAVGLAYRYFPSKDALVAELYGRLLDEWAERARAMPKGKWIERSLWLTRLSLEVLAPHRLLLRALLGPMLAGDPTASPLHNPASRAKGEPEFLRAVRDASDAPRNALELGAAAHLGQLAILFFWTVDRSPGLRATRGLLAALEGLAPLVAFGLKTPILRTRLLALAEMVRDGLAGDDRDARAAVRP
jgi:AcrR family transcriptional regulator